MSIENYKTVFSEINEAEQIAAISFTFADRMKSVINSMGKEIQALEVERDEARLAIKVYLENQTRPRKGTMLEIRGQISHVFWRDDNAFLCGESVVILDNNKETVEALLEALFYVSRDRDANKPQKYGEYRRVISEITGEICAELQKGPSSITLQELITWTRTRQTKHAPDVGAVELVPPADQLYEDAKSAAREIGYVSVGKLQSKLRTGYTRAASLVQRMESEGFCGPVVNEGGRRELLAKK